MDRLGQVRRGKAVKVRRGRARSVLFRNGEARQGGQGRLGAARHGVARCG